MATAVTDSTFEAEVLKSDIPVLVDFWAPWCGPCKAMTPVMEELSEKYKGKLKIVKMNVDENTTIPEKFGVMSIPTFAVIKKGEIVDTFVGARPKEDFTVKLDALV